MHIKPRIRFSLLAVSLLLMSILIYQLASAAPHAASSITYLVATGSPLGTVQIDFETASESDVSHWLIKRSSTLTGFIPTTQSDWMHDVITVTHNGQPMQQIPASGSVSAGANYTVYDLDAAADDMDTSWWYTVVEVSASSGLPISHADSFADDATVSVSSNALFRRSVEDVLIYESRPSITQTVQIFDVGDQVRAYSNVHAITAGDNCTQQTPSIVDCPKADATRLHVAGGAFNDTFTIMTPLTTTVHGDLGEDTARIYGTAGDDSIAYSEVVIDRTGLNPVAHLSIESIELHGGAGSDTLHAMNVDADVTMTMCGSDGGDLLTINGYVNGTAIADGGADGDTILLDFTGTGTVIAYGGPGGDLIRNDGSVGAVLHGGGGADVCATALFSCGTVTDIPINECEALVELYTSTGGSDWTQNVGWLQTNTPCAWFGVTCQDGTVAGLNLAANQLVGTLPATISNLTNLQSLQVDNNAELSGPLPLEIMQLTQLATLHYDHTALCEPADLPFYRWLIALDSEQRTAILCENPLLGIYVLAFDNAVDSPSNLTPRFGETLQSIVNATVADPFKIAIVLADLERDGDTHILMIRDGNITPILGLPDVNGTLDITLNEYSIGDGAQLGGFLKWALTTYASEQTKTVLSIVGHGTFITPEVEMEVLKLDRTTDAAIPLPLFIGVHDDFSDMNPQPSFLTPYDIQQMLEIGTEGATNPIDVLDIVHCFAATIEQFYELANDGGVPYAETIIGSPNYTFFAPEMSGNSFASIMPTMTVPAMTQAIMTTYDDVMTAHDAADGDLDVDHPHVLVAMTSAEIPAIKAQMDALAAQILKAYEVDVAATRQKLQDAYNNTAQFYDTTYCGAEWELAVGDALVDIDAFMTQIAIQFGGEVATEAVAVQAVVANAMLYNISIDGTPWFAEPATPHWSFNGAGLALYADFYVNPIDSEKTRLALPAPFYTKNTTIQTPNDNPHPYRFVQGEATWGDVFQAYWASDADIMLETVYCLPAYPPAAEYITLEAEGGLDRIDIRWQIDNPLVGTLDTYRLYVYEVGSMPVLLSESATAQFTHTDGVVGRDYCYFVEALEAPRELGAPMNVIATSNTDCTRFGELTLIIPDVNLPPDAAGFAVPVSVVNASGLCIGAMGLDIEYDPAVVTITGVRSTPYTAEFKFEATTAEPGKARVAAVMSLDNPCEELSGAGALFELLLDVSGRIGDTSVLDVIKGLTATYIYDKDDLIEPVALQLADGSVSIYPEFSRGDVNGDGVVNAADAYLALQIKNARIVPTVRQTLACDVNGDRVCNSADSTRILCHAVYGSWTDCGLLSRRLAATPSSIGVELLEVEQVIWDGDTQSWTNAYVPVRISGAESIAGGTLTFTYDPELIAVTDIVTTTTVLADAIIRVDHSSPGVLNVSFASIAPISSDGVLFYIEAIMPRYASSLRLAAAEFNSLSGLDMVTNLGSSIVVTQPDPTLRPLLPPSMVQLSAQQTVTPTLNPILWVAGVMIFGFVTLGVLRRKRTV